MDKWMKLLIIGMAAIALIAIFKLSLSGVQKTVSTFLDSNLAMLLAGTAMHFLMGLSALQKEASLTLTGAIHQQWTTRSADVLLGVVGAFAGYAIISEMNMLNAASAKKPTTPDSAVFAQIGKTDKVTNEHDASIARSQAVASTIGAVVWPLAMVAGLKSIFGALAGLGRNEINATNSDVVVGRDGSNNQGTGGDIRVGSPNSTSTTTDTRTDTRTDTNSTNSQSNSSGDNN